MRKWKKKMKRRKLQLVGHRERRLTSTWSATTTRTTASTRRWARAIDEWPTRRSWTSATCEKGLRKWLKPGRRAKWPLLQRSEKELSKAFARSKLFSIHTCFLTSLSSLYIYPWKIIHNRKKFCFIDIFLYEGFRRLFSSEFPATCWRVGIFSIDQGRYPEAQERKFEGSVVLEAIVNCN